MRKLKKLVLVLVLAALPSLTFPFTTISASTFDFGVYGGYAKDKDTSASGSSIGLFGGVSYGITFIRAGLHVFSDNTKLDEFNRTSMGISLRAQLALPIFPLEPYLKAGLSFMDVFAVSGGQVERDYFSTYLLGAGIEFNMIPFVKPFVEYNEWNSSWHNSTIKNYTMIAGIKIAM